MPAASRTTPSSSASSEIVADLDTPLRKAIGDKTARAFASGLDVHTIDDLLRHYPRRYAEHGKLTSLDDLTVGEHVSVMARVQSAHSRRMKNRPGTICEVVVTDGRGRLSLTFFARGDQQWRAKQLSPGRVGLFAGKVEDFKGKRQLTHPDYQLVDELADADEVTSFAYAPIPVYPATKDLATWNIAKAVRTVLDIVQFDHDPIPEDVRQRHSLVEQKDAFTDIHRPQDWKQIDRARKRLKWDEAFVLQVALAQRRAAARARPTTPRPARAGGLLEAFDARLPFELTAGQVDVSKAIFEDLADKHPMHRLLQGEVGSGKTVVALRAMLAVIDAGGQAALLAPTEVLAHQHYRSISTLLGPLAESGQLGGAEVATRIALLTGSLGAAPRRSALLDAASGAAGILIGTHALLQESVQFADLGLVVVDEQHRFGVEQREALRAKGANPPHVLVMTATPIPRTVAMTVYGDLDVSTLTELPAGRAPIQTSVVPASERPDWLDRAWQRVREEAREGRQAYVVCPRIGDAEGAEDDAGTEGEPDPETGGTPRRPAVAVLDVLPALVEGPLKGLRVEAMHGRLPSDDKDAVMRRFVAGETDVLLSTTVIEVGVDVANATVMVVLDADRFGVSQLHQLRGRVGRGSHPGLCLLVTDVEPGAPARDRLDAVAETLDGFRLSELDLEQRREGDVLGATQAGRRSSLRLLSVLRDAELITAAREEASALVDEDPELVDHPLLARALATMLEPERAEFLEKA
jgi:ATP-dependent DNA helicase RecG